ncbi:MAG: hypothetical protein GF375_02685 [Candidatus Omnitrophica bacterium]|nr:hypothetical protein [Candidatus Omnitrophota bacterium]MBD3269004.1 hypothetical protein [Candidatus Omnitrophota bacterium]
MRGDRLQASFDNPNDFAGWIITLFPFLAVSFFYFKNKLKSFLSRVFFVLYPLLLIGAIFVIGMTFSRGAWFGYGISMVFLSAIILRSKYSGVSGRRRKEKGLLILAISCIIVPLAAGLTLIEPIAERIETLEEGLEEAGHRRTNWQEAAAIVEDFPILGTGPNTYTLVGPNYSLREGGGIYPHNCYLQIAAETGILGLAAFLWVILRFFRLSIRKIKKEGGVLLLGINAGLLAYLVQSFFDTNLFSLKLAVLFWFMLGLGTSLFYYEDR